MAIAPVDIYVLCGLTALDTPAHAWTQRSLAERLGIPLASVHRALRNAEGSQLYDPKRKSVQRAAFETLLVHAAPYVLPPRRLGLTVGMPTADAAPVLAGRIRAGGDRLPLVWPQAEGVRGEGLKPLHAAAPAAAARDSELYALLALVDALRTGTARVRGVAGELLADRLRSGMASSS